MGGVLRLARCDIIILMTINLMISWFISPAGLADMVVCAWVDLLSLNWVGMEFLVRGVRKAVILSYYGVVDGGLSSNE